ncbi:MAG: hypothetical protein NPINA01_05580 [Nitrospinaceae bacterium]|nr:MAG: hypothetical protein NPINA01_05580 [Nitrospinaceae bacterium]
MRLNHLDILEQCFREKFRGYNKQEVDTFLHLVADDFKEMSEEIERLEKELAKKSRIIRKLKKENPAGSDSNDRPPQITQELIKERAKLVLLKAREQAESHKKKAEQDLEGLKQEIHKLTQEKSNLIKSLKASAREHLQQFKK